MYDDWKLSKWIEEHPADLFNLMQSEINLSFYLTKLIEYFIFLFAIWRSTRVSNQKLTQQLKKVEMEQGDLDVLQRDHQINASIHTLRINFFN